MRKQITAEQAHARLMASLPVIAEEANGLFQYFIPQAGSDDIPYIITVECIRLEDLKLEE